MPRIEWQALAACAGAILSGAMLIGIGILIDPARATARARRRQ